MNLRQRILVFQELVAYYIEDGFDLASARELAHANLRQHAPQDGIQQDIDEDRESSGGPGA